MIGWCVRVVRAMGLIRVSTSVNWCAAQCCTISDLNPTQCFVQDRWYLLSCPCQASSRRSEPCRYGCVVLRRSAGRRYSEDGARISYS